ncbi:MAG: dTMP kinase [bacterium]
MSGMIISFEGIDASGKTTQIARLEKWFQAQGFDVLVRREPGGTELGERIRDILLDPRWREMHPRTEFLLYSASRAQLVEEDLLPFLQREKAVVLLDRYYDSSTAYQGAGRGLAIEEVKHVNRFATAELRPHLTFFFDLSLAEAGRRKGHQTRASDRLESSSDAFYERVRQGYSTICTEEPDRMVRLDASLSEDEIAAQILANVKTLLANKGMIS